MNLSEHVEQPFDLEHGPLHRVTLFQIGKEEHIFLWVRHHAITDGWSAELLLDELRQLYSAFIRGEPSPLAPLTLQYADYTLWQRERLGDETAFENEKAYWQKQLEGVSDLLELPMDRSRPSEPSRRGGNYSHTLSQNLRGGVEALSRSQGATPFMGLLAVFQVLLYRHSGQEDFCVGSPSANRPLAEMEGIVGCFINTLAFRSGVSSEANFTETLQRVKQVCLEAYENQNLPFELLVNQLKGERGLSHHPLFQVLFVLENARSYAARDRWGDLRVKKERLTNRMAKFDLTLNIAETPEGLHCRWKYARDLFDVETIGRMARDFEGLLKAVLANPEAKIAVLPLPSESE